MIVDSHTHINDPAFINDVEGYIKLSSLANVKAFLCIGYDLKSSIESVKLANQYPNIYAAVGIHPTETKSASEKDLLEIEKLLNNPKVIAVGEVGLDFYWDKEEKIKNLQLNWFNKFIDLANRYHKPIIIHSRDAINLTYETLLNHKVNKAGIIHCYSAGKDYVKRYLELGYYFGIGGTVTFKNAISVKEAVKEIPLDRLLLETDAPYLAPTPYRGKQNHSQYIPLVIKEISYIKGINAEEIEKETTKNFEKLFSVKL